MYRFFRPLLFRLDPETAHGLALNLVRLAGILPPARWLLQAMYSAPEKPVEAFGLKFKNPVGLAAGYDKDGVAIRGLSALGFGHLEIGTVTPRPQPGNPKPRIFRLVEDEAVINRMGFPGKGADSVEVSLRATEGNEAISSVNRRLLRRRFAALRNDTRVIIGVNLGKNKDTPLENAADDYITLMRRFMSLADYLAINISSPNTVGLRRLQGRKMLAGLLGAIAEERATLALPEGHRDGVSNVEGCNLQRPILVKIAPDLSDDELDDALGVILDMGMDGVIATNTTLGREGLTSRHQGETGGLSGRPLTVHSEAVLEKVVKRLNGRLPVVSVGGIMSPDDAKRRLEMGAALVQVYTGLVYDGPGLVRKIIQSG